MVASENVTVIDRRIRELRSWIAKNPQGSEVAQSDLAKGRCDACWNCGYLAALEYASYLLFDETGSLGRSPSADKKSDTIRASGADSAAIPALNNAAETSDRPPIDRRIRSLDRRRGERRTAGLEPRS